MNRALDKFFKLSARKSNFKTEILAGIVTFIALIYILPVNTNIIGGGMGMNENGVFAATAILSGLCCIIMGMLANVPFVLSAGMGMNAFLAYTVGGSMGFSWQESMILLFASGILFFILSVTPIRTKMMAKFPKDIKLIISAGLGAFIAFVGLRNGGVITQGSGTPVALGDFSNPGVLIAIIGIILVLGFMFSKVKFLKRFSIPLVLLIAAVVATVISTILINANGSSAEAVGALGLPVAPWDSENLNWLPRGLQDVLFFGFISKNPAYMPDKSFGAMLANVFSNPATYIAIFSLIFVNLFDTTATVLTLSNKVGLINEETGAIKGGNRIVIADAIGSLVCAPLGTSTTTTFAESSIGVELGARTGIASITTGLLFILSAFIYPVFSFFSVGSVTAPALVAVGALIFTENFKGINWKDPIASVTGFITVIFMLLTYSLADGLGIGLIAYVVMMLFAGRHKELNVVLYILCAFFILSFGLNALLPHIT